ncbi:MAG: hypothetical protein AABY10_00320 [Nanoarchaeota archaeon]
MEVDRIDHTEKLYLEFVVSDGGQEAFFEEIFKEDKRLLVEDFKKKFLERFKIPPKFEVATQEYFDAKYADSILEGRRYFPLLRQGRTFYIADDEKPRS